MEKIVGKINSNKFIIKKVFKRYSYFSCINIFVLLLLSVIKKEMSSNKKQDRKITIKRE